jgi:hypothetical protein
MMWQTFVLRLIELLRPRFYNRITWVIVFAGIAIMSTQLWELIANEFLKTQFNISVSGNNDAAWGFALCVLGLLYHMANTGFYELLKANETRARQEMERQHDQAIFQKASELLNDQQIESFVQSLQDDHSYYMSESGRIESFVRFLATTSNHFLRPPIAEAACRFLQAWGELNHFISYKFFVFPKNQKEPPLRLCMTPGLNMDREGSGSPDQVAKYDKLTEELVSFSEKAIYEYRAFRTAIKNELVI